MSYATVANLKNRFPESVLAELTMDSGTESDDEMLESILTEVDGLIETAARSAGYVTPVKSVVTATMSTLASHELSIAKFLLLDRRGLTAYDPSAETLYRAAMDFLRDLRKGDPPIELAGAARQAPEQTSAGTVIAGSDERVFGQPSRAFDARRGI